MEKLFRFTCLGTRNRYGADSFAVWSVRCHTSRHSRKNNQPVSRVFFFGGWVVDLGRTLEFWVIKEQRFRRGGGISWGRGGGGKLLGNPLGCYSFGVMESREGNCFVLLLGVFIWYISACIFIDGLEVLNKHCRTLCSRPELTTVLSHAVSALPIFDRLKSFLLEFSHTAT